MVTGNWGRHSGHPGSKGVLQTSSRSLDRARSWGLHCKKINPARGILLNISPLSRRESQIHLRDPDSTWAQDCMSAQDSAFCYMSALLPVDFQWSSLCGPAHGASLNLPGYVAWTQARVCYQNSIFLVPQVSISDLPRMSLDQMTPPPLSCGQKSDG